LPETVPAPATAPPAESAEWIYTMAEMEALERQNFEMALERCKGRISGEQGAAQLLGMKPSTLASRLKVLGLKSRR